MTTPKFSPSGTAMEYVSCRTNSFSGTILSFGCLGDLFRHIFTGACGTEVENHVDTFLQAVHAASIHLQPFLAVLVYGFLQTADHGILIFRHSAVDAHRHGDMLGAEMVGTIRQRINSCISSMRSLSVASANFPSDTSRERGVSGKSVSSEA